MVNLLVIIRGNSATRKTMMAERIRIILEHKNCFVIHQDVVRKEILHTHDYYNNPAISLIEELAEYGLEHYSVTVIEGILRKDVYGEMFTELLSNQNLALSNN